MKLIASALTYSAAMHRSPSFSRSGESTTTTMRPALISSIASSMLQKGDGSSLMRFLGEQGREPVGPALRWRLAAGCRGSGQQTLHVARDHVGLEVHRIADPELPERWHLEGVRDDRDREAVVVQLGDREAHAGDGDAALLDQVALDDIGGAEPQPAAHSSLAPLDEPSHSADVPLHDVAAIPPRRPQRPL